MPKTGKKVPDSEAVAYVEDGPDGPGLYIMEGEAEESEVRVMEGKMLENPDHDPDDEDSSPFQLTANGKTQFESEPQVVSTKTVKHETNYEPTTKVYASPDGEGFVYNDPEGSDE